MQSSSGEYIQVLKKQFYGHLEEHQRVNAKCKQLESKLKAFSNLSEVVNRQEQELRLYKKTSQQYESAYVASEAKLSHLLQMWINASKKKSSLSDIEVIENLLKLSPEDLYTSHRALQGELIRKRVETETDNSKLSNRSSHQTNVEEDGGEQPNDLEEDSDRWVDNKRAPVVKSPEKTAASDTKTSQFETDSLQSIKDSTAIVSRGVQSKSNTIKVDRSLNQETVTSEAKFASGSPTRTTEKSVECYDRNESSSVNVEVMEHLYRENDKLLKTIKEFKAHSSEGWKAYVVSVLISA